LQQSLAKHAQEKRSIEEDKEVVHRELGRAALRERMLRAELEASTRERAEATSADRFARASAEAEITRLRQALDEAHECNQRLEARAVHFDEQYRRLWRATHDPVYVAATGKAPNEGFRPPPTRREREVVERRESSELESLPSFSKSRTESDSTNEDDDESLNASLGSPSSSFRSSPGSAALIARLERAVAMTQAVVRLPSSPPSPPSRAKWPLKPAASASRSPPRTPRSMFL